MQLFSGTSGFSYKEWKGHFYPADLADKKMLHFYSRQLTTVEINNTFYRMPRSEVMAGWAEQVPDGFRFVVKASQRITHRARLREAGELVSYLWSAARHLGEHLGPLLFQLPPNFKKESERLEAFLAELPEGCRAAFEFRHDSWDDDGVDELLRGAGAARVVSDASGEPRMTATADWGYLRLRADDYSEQELDAWAARLHASDWREAFVFFKHEGDRGPEWARALAERFAAQSSPREDEGGEAGS